MRVRIAIVLKIALLVLAFHSSSNLAEAQTTSVDGPWSGQVVCQLNMQGTGYVRQETQTWTIAGPQLRVQGAMHLYPVTWTATGSGSVQRNQNGQAFTAQWSLNPPPTNGTFAVFVRASDSRLIFRAWHTQLRADFALRGTKQGSWNGTAQQPAALAQPTYEWQLPWMDADPSSTAPSGNFSVNAEQLTAELGNPPELQRVASCSWHFNSGSSGSVSAPATNSGSMNTPSMPGSTTGSGSQNGGVNPQNSGVASSNGGGCTGSANDIAQTFASMKASLAQQYDRLIQEASDLATKQSLQAQKQRTLAALDAQQQKDLQSAASGCNGVIAQNGGMTGSGIPNAQGSNGGSTAIPKPGTTSPIMPVDTDPPAPHHKQSLANPTSLGFIDVGRTNGAAPQFSYTGDNYVYQFQFPAGAQAMVTLGGDAGSNYTLNQYSQNLAIVGSASTMNSQLSGFTITSDGNVDTILLEVVGKTGISSYTTCTVSVAVFPGAGAGGAPGNTQSGAGSTAGSAQSGAAAGASQGSAGGGTGATTGNTQNGTGTMGGAGQSGASSGANQGAAGGGAAGGSTGGPTSPVGHTQSLNAPINLGTLQIGQSVTYTQDFLTPNDNYVFQFSFAAGAVANVTLAAQNPGTNFVLNQYKNFAISSTAALSNTLSTSMAIPSDGNLDTVLLDLRASSWSATSERFVLTVVVNAAPVGGTATPLGTGVKLAPIQGTAVALPPKIAKTINTGATGNAGATGNTGATGSTPVPSAASSKYVVAISGILCTRAASSSDAIYAAAYSRHYDRHTGKLSSSSSGPTDPASAYATLQSGGAVSSGSPATSIAQTMVYGDVNGWIGKRQQAGSRSPTGGIGIGDMIPAPPAFVPGIPNQLPLQTNLFPLSIWQGSLTDGADAVVISPSLWINYGDNPMFTTWKTNEQSMDSSIFLDSKIQAQMSSQTLGALYLGPSATGAGSIQTTATNVANDVAETSIASFFMIPPIMLLFDHPTHDRPIGVADGSFIGDSHVASTYTYVPNATIVLTREIVEKALAGRSWAIVGINFKDTTASFNDMPGNDRKAEYSMFLQIQRQQ